MMRSPSRARRPARATGAFGALLLGATLAGSAAPSLGQIPALHECPLASRLSLSRDEGRCVRARLGMLEPIATGASRAADPGAGGGPGRFSLAPAPVESVASYRSAYPEDRNDGLLWEGRGASASLSAGVVSRLGPLTVAVSPEVAWSRNRAFVLPDSTPVGWSPYADPWGAPGLDAYLRPGADPLWAVGPGDSYVELGAGPVRAGLSTERIWWGPARRYALLFSGTAAGFPHVYAETASPVALGSGGVSLHALAGRLDESEWFDADEGNDLRLLTAAQASWRLGFVPGLEVAVSAVRHEPWERDGGSRTSGTLSFRASFPDAGIEAYGEIGRGDLFVNGQAGASDTRHAQVYALGFTRSDTTASGRPWRVWGELTRQALELPQPASGPPDSAYVGAAALQGHTYRGQLLGAWIGPGSNAQIIGLDLPGERIAWGVFAERVRRDDDTFFRIHYPHYGFRGHDLQWTLAARAARDLTVGRAGTLRAHAEGGVSRRKNRSFVGLDGGLNWTLVREWNVWTDLTLSWYPDSRR